MSDLTKVQASQTTNLVGTDSTGLVTNAVGADSAGDLKVVTNNTGTTGSAVPSVSALQGGKDGSGNLQAEKVDSFGTQYVAITSPALGAIGAAAAVSLTGGLSVNIAPGTLLQDSFDSAGLDVTNRWGITLLTGGTQTQSLGLCTLATTTAASSSVQLSSQPTFVPGSSFYFAGIGIQYEATLQTNTHRFWGFGTPAASFTAATPLLNAVGFEIDTSANLSAVIYSNGVKTQSTNLNAYKSSSALSYVIVYRADSFLFYISTIGFEIPVASFSNAVLDSIVLPWRTHIINGVTPPASAPSLALSGLAIGDSNSMATTQLSDSVSPWRKATIKPLGALNLSTDTELVTRAVPTDGTKNTYSTSVTGLATTANATDFFIITGSASKTVRVTNIEITGTTGGLGGQTADIQLIKRSSANGTNGGPTTRTAVPHDSTDPAATAVVRTFSGNPTLGTTVGQIRAQRIDLANGGNLSSMISWNFGSRPGQALVIRGISEVLSLNLNGVSLNTPLLDISIEWTEE